MLLSADGQTWTFHLCTVYPQREMLPAVYLKNEEKSPFVVVRHCFCCLIDMTTTFNDGDFPGL